MKTQKIASLLVLAAACLAAGCADASSERIGEARENQLPIDTDVAEISFSSLIRLVVTSNALPGGSSYRGQAEYWAGSTSTSVASLSSLSMSTTSVSSPSDAQIAGFLAPNGSFGSPFQTGQVLSTSDWTRGTYTSSATTKKLFEATDPDDSNHRIAMLIEQDGSNGLTGVVWYKTSNTGTIFASTPSSLSFTAVLDGSNNPSLDPADIEPAATWYYYADH